MGDQRITAARLRELLHYDPETGVFTWRVRRRRVRIGASPKPTKGNRYLRIGIDGAIWLAHRLAWLYMTGNWPKDDVDHRDGDGLNNRWSNLRDVTPVVNGQNRRGAQSNNRSGLLGASFDAFTGRYVAKIAVERELHEGCTL